MRKKAKYLFLIASVVSIVLFLFTTGGFINHKGAESKEAIMKAYLNGLTANDSQAILELTPSYYESREAVQQVIKKYGGNRFKNIKIKYLQSESTGIWFALLTGVTIDKEGESYPYKYQVTLGEGKNNKWFLLLGGQK